MYRSATSDSDELRVDTSVTFVWVADSGNSYTENDEVLTVDQDWNMTYVPMVSTAPSRASGSATFEGVSSSENFTETPWDFGFLFSNRAGVTAADMTAGDTWSWNPATGVLDPVTVGGSWDNWIGAFFWLGGASFGTSHWSGSTSDTESGHWVLAPDIHDVDVVGGAGDDTIYAGQGTETLSGDEGDDTIYAGRGDQFVFGGSGNDTVHGGVGWQTLDGGDGNDTIYGGTGTQTLMGDAGNDVIHGGWGRETLEGGTGSDTLWAGSGAQFLDGGAGADVLHAGDGNDTLTGGAGRDTFAFDRAPSGRAASGHDVITDFHVGQDIVQVAKAIIGLAATRPADLAAHVTADASGAAVFALGAGATVTFTGVSAGQLIAHAATTFRLV